MGSESGVTKSRPRRQDFYRAVGRSIVGEKEKGVKSKAVISTSLDAPHTGLQRTSHLGAGADTTDSLSILLAIFPGLLTIITNLNLAYTLAFCFRF